MTAAEAAVTLPACNGIVHAQSFCDGIPCPGQAPHEWTLDADLHAIDMDASSAWHLSFRSESCWAADITTAPGVSSVEMQLWRRAVLHGTFTGRERPRHLEAAIRTPTGAHGTPIPESVTECSMRESEWSCPGPAATVDVRLQPSDFAPQYLWDVALTTAHAVEIGAIPLIRGGSIAGWLETGKHGGLVRVELTQETFKLAGDAARRADERKLTATANARGFFQFRSLPPSSYSLTAIAADGSTATLTGIKVNDGREHVLERPLQLQALGIVQVTVAPPITPAGQPWTVRIQHILSFTPFPITAAEGLATNGSWRGRLQPGKYQVQVLDIAGSIHERSEINVIGGPQEVPIAVQHVAVEGRVHVGNDGVAADLRFTSKDANVKMRSDKDGKFAGLLPGDGKYNVRIEESRLTRDRTVELRRGDDGVIHADLALPPGRISGEVVDSTGRPRFATVEVRWAASNETTRFASDEKTGQFDVRGLEPGPAQVDALSGDDESNQIPVTIGESEGSRIHLVVATTRKLHGIVTSPSGEPVAGALVRILSDSMYGLREAPTGMNGGFSVVVPGSVSNVEVVVVAPGLPTKMMALALNTPDDDETDIPVGGAAGRLYVQKAHAPPWPLVSHDHGMVVPMSMLLAPPDRLNPSRNHGPDGTIFIDLEAGDYTVCGGIGDSQHCETSHVVAGSSQTIDVRPRSKEH